MSANELQLPKTPALPPPPQELPLRPAPPQEVPPVQPPDVQSIPPKELPPDVPQELPPEQLPQELPLESPHLQSSTGRSATQQLVGTTIRGTISRNPVRVRQNTQEMRFYAQLYISSGYGRPLRLFRASFLTTGRGSIAADRRGSFQ